MSVQTELDKQDPYRDFNWRFKRAVELVEDYRLPDSFQLYDDSYVRRYAALLSDMKTKDIKHFKYRLKPEQRVVYNTHMFKEQKDGFSNHLLEAYILAGCSNTQISEYFNITPDGVHWYERLYFDVRSRLNKPMFILPRIFDLSTNGAKNLAYGCQERSGGVVGPGAIIAMIKLFGYYGGPKVIEIMYSGMTRGPIPTTADATKVYLNEALLSCLRVKGLMAVRAADLNKYNLQGLIDSALTAVKENQLDGNLTVMQNVQQFIDATRHYSGTPSETLPPDSLAKDFMVTSFEPRASELLTLSRGKVPADLKNLTIEVE